MIVLVTGSRHGAPDVQIERALTRCALMASSRGERLTVVHGAAKGVDAQADRIAEVLGANVMRFPAEWAMYGKAAGPVRNREMLDTTKPDLVLAFLAPNSRGTRDMIEVARRQGYTVIVEAIA